MGLKYGFAEMASRRGLCVTFGGSTSPAFSYARVFFSCEECDDRIEMKVYLRFLNGSIGHLRKNNQAQLEVWFIEFADWVPTKEQVAVIRDGKKLPQEMLLFGGTHVIQEITVGGFLPPNQIHHDDEDRFKNPKGLWNQVVASCLLQGQMMG